MTNLDKFYSDADRLMTKASGQTAGTAAGAEKLAAELSRQFLLWTRDFGDLAEGLATWWAEKYSSTMKTEEGRKKAVNWFGALLALLTGNFAADMDFPPEDWEEIRDAVSASADELDMDIIMSIMTIIVERGHA